VVGDARFERAGNLAGGSVNGVGTATLMDALSRASTASPGPRQHELRGVAESVGAARRLVAHALPGCPRADDLVQAVSELATSAIEWSASGEGGAFGVRVRLAPRWARIEVRDSGPALLPVGERNGWGLGIVAALTDRFGSASDADGTHVVWAEVTWPHPPPKAEQPAPSASERPAPSASERPAPSASERPAPSASERPAPSAAEQPAPSAPEPVP
jgi:anti-sigma regulatory factor (Ser/Thr protein kinase)